MRSSVGRLVGVRQAQPRPRKKAIALARATKNAPGPSKPTCPKAATGGLNRHERKKMKQLSNATTFCSWGVEWGHPLPIIYSAQRHFPLTAKKKRPAETNLP